MSERLEGSVKDLRYQPVPPGRKPLSASPDVVKFWLMLKSCGRSTDCQSASLKFGFCAEVEFPRKNFHPELKRLVRFVTIWLTEMSSASPNVAEEAAAFVMLLGIAGIQREAANVTASNFLMFFFMGSSFLNKMV